MGRPTKYTKAIDAEICDKISRGIPLAEICRQDNMPDRSTIYDWINDNPDFSLRFARARDIGFDAIAEEALDIADDSTNDWMDRRISEDLTIRVLDAEHVQRSKLRIETRLKLLAKWSPKKYGDKTDITTNGKDIQPVSFIIQASEENVKKLNEL